jgi:hypothetical protein
VSRYPRPASSRPNSKRTDSDIVGMSRTSPGPPAVGVGVNAPGDGVAPGDAGVFVGVLVAVLVEALVGV